ncbi:MAG: HAD hydrolase-like protein [Candidatus Pacebacteria bacterium]|nr:HAD hydrolase-like protein [Candidatus Paceibacterota bacterium]MDR3583548.1 HAD hydrolase-like protein [Candidatus Paceibacterota bacterium]
MAGDGRKVIIFDFDGTIADSFLVLLEIFNEMADIYKYEKVVGKDVPLFQNLSSRQVMQRFGVPKWKLFFIVRKGKKLFRAKLPQVSPVEGMRETLVMLRERKYALGILTSNAEKNVRDFLAAHGIDVFDFVYSENNLFGKARALKKIMRRHGFLPDKTAYVGDETRDIEAAKKNGLMSVAVSWGFNSKEVLEKFTPDYLAEQPQELLKIF